MLSTLLLLVALWAVTVPAVLALGGLLSRVSAPRVAFAEGEEEAPPDNVVPLVPRPQNGLEALRRASEPRRS